MLTDFNDLYVSAGADEVKRQLYAAKELFKTVQCAHAANDVPDSPDQTPVPTQDPENNSPRTPLDEESALKAILNRYALIHGETKVWDLQSRQMIKKVAFVELVGKALFAKWSEHVDRRVVDKRETQQGGQSDHSGDDVIAKHVLERYVYIYPTKDAWDYKREVLIPLDTLKAAIPNYFDWWMKHLNRRVIDQERLVFDPTQRVDRETHINTFTGLPHTPSGEAGACSDILYILLSLCNEDHELYDWVVKWLAFPLQNLGAKMDTALIFHSDTQGTGKSLFFADMMTRIYGKYSTVVGQHQLESQYTDWRSRLLYCVFEEIFSRDQKYSHTGTVKHMVTGKTQRIEKKFVSGWEEANHMNGVFLSNEIQPFPLERSDRRMMVVWPKIKLDDSAFRAAALQANNGGVEALHNYLMDYKLGDFDQHTKPPMTEAKRRLINFGLPSWEVFLDEWTEGYLSRPFVSCKSTSLFAFYKDKCGEWNERPISMQRFMGFVASRYQVAKKRYRKAFDVEGPVSFVVIGPVPAGKQEQDWLGWNQEQFEGE